MKKVLITGSAGLIGSESVRFFCSIGFEVYGVDNNMRQYFFGEEASTDWNRELLEQQYKNYKHYAADIRDQKAINEIFSNHKFDLIIHTAAQPSHDWAAKEPLTDFTVNANGTLVLLEAYKKYCPEAAFIFTSTNKVYGDLPNFLPLIELDTRYEIDPNHKYKNGIDESMSIDNSKHSVFGASKVAADVMVQEYGKYFDLHTTVFRGGCLTGPAHSGTQLHGFLAYLIKCIAEGRPYTIFGYKGKQVRDNIHSSDLIAAFYEFYKNPRVAEVYNMGGSRFSNISMIEAIEKTENYLGRKGDISYSDKNRSGDHMWYVSDVGKFKEHYPNWEYKYDGDAIIQEICEMGHFSKPDVGKLVVSKVGYGDEVYAFVSSHVTEAFGPVQALKSHLIKKYSKFVFVEHPFTYSNVAGSRLDAYRGSLVSTQQEKKKLKIESLSYFSDFLLTIYWFLKVGKSSKLFIGIDALNALAGVVLKAVGFKFKLIYYTVDYSPKRFKNSFMNFLYHQIDKIAIKYADHVWNSSERIATVRKSQGVADSKNVVVPNGVNLAKIDLAKKRDKNSLVIVEHLTSEKGVQLAIKALKAIRKINNDAKLVIFGTGPYEQNLKMLVSKHKMLKHVEFKGDVSPEEYLPLLSSYGIGLCLHTGKKDDSVYFSDPISPKEFLAAGLPVVVTESLWIGSDVEEKELGKAIAYEEEDLVNALQEIWNKRGLYTEMSDNAKKYGSAFLWGDSFDEALGKVE
ncbi:NAD-dependent epimerase/dehydratase family protein [Patescibacteria group bacterium]|nr:NAD-dependent epimerase/dehydratase family protein [Patescibacteria group bacterium]